MANSLQEPIDPRLLSMFVELAESGSMQLVAKSLNITPSAISHGIKRLEEVLGCSLFERQGRRLILNARGYLFLPEAKELLQHMQAVIQRFHNKADWRLGRLRIGSNSIGCEQILPTVIREYRDSFPEVTISIQEGGALELVEALQARQLDFALVQSSRDYKGLTQIPLAREDLVFLLNPLHAWAQTGRVNRSEIPQQKFILSPRQSESFRIIDEYFRIERIPIEPFIEIRSETVIKKLVELDLGISVLPRWIANVEIAAERLCEMPLGRRPLMRQWEILHLQGRELSFAETLFTGLTKTVTIHLIQG